MGEREEEEEVLVGVSNKTFKERGTSQETPNYKEREVGREREREL